VKGASPAAVTENCATAPSATVAGAGGVTIDGALAVGAGAGAGAERGEGAGVPAPAPPPPPLSPLPPPPPQPAITITAAVTNKPTRTPEIDFVLLATCADPYLCGVEKKRRYTWIRICVANPAIVAQLGCDIEFDAASAPHAQ
jgi:hypothetical protein